MRSFSRAFLALLVFGCGIAHAAWPSDKPIRIVVGFEAGGQQDIAMRTLAPYLQKYLEGSTVIVENKPGAAGELAYATISHSPPDGYTFSTISVPGFMTMQIAGPVNFEPKDLVPVARIVNDDTTLAVNSNSPYKDLKELLQAAKAKPGTISFGGSGIGTNDHLAAMLFHEKGIDFNYVPYRGGAGAIQAALGNHIDVAATSTAIYDHIQGLRPVAVLAEHRAAALPNVPTAREQGLDVLMSSERGIATHSKVPADIRKRFAQAVKTAMDDPEFQAKAQKLGFSLAYLNGEEWSAVLQKRRATYQAIWDKTPWQ